MLQNNPLTGLLFIIGIVWGAFAASNVAVAIGALAGLIVSTLTAILLNADRASLQQGHVRLQRHIGWNRRANDACK